MRLEKIRSILSLLILLATSFLIVSILLMIYFNRETRINTEKDYAIFQNDIFQHSLFLNKSIVTIHELLWPDTLSGNYSKDKS